MNRYKKSVKIQRLCKNIEPKLRTIDVVKEKRKNLKGKRIQKAQKMQKMGKRKVFYNF